jgi:hypothetical protein
MLRTIALYGLAPCLSAALLGCASAPADPIGDVWDNPERHDGETFELTAYPYDLPGDPQRYIMCTEPCSEGEAQREQAVIHPSVEGRFDGWRGNQAVVVRVRFDGHCFRPQAICFLDHRPFIFQQLD